MTPTAPDWLALHRGSLKTALDGQSLIVLVGEEPQYLVTPVPVAGKHGSQVKQTVNGRPVPSTGTFNTAAEAVRGGLEDLRKSLGW